MAVTFLTNEDRDDLQSQIDGIKNSGLTEAQVNALDGMFKKCAFTGDVSAEYEAFKKAFTHTENGGETDEPEIPDVPETPVDPEPDEPDTPVDPDPEAVIYNVFAGEYENTGYSGTLQEQFGSNFNIYKTKIDVTDADKVYFRLARTNMTHDGTFPVPAFLAVYASDDTLLGTIDVFATENVTTEHAYYEKVPNAGLAVIETLDDGTSIYSKNVGSVSLTNYPTKAYVLFVAKTQDKSFIKWSGTAQSTSPLTLEGV